MKTDIKLDANIDAGEGEMRVMPHFEKMNTLWQLDVLKDWIWDLQELYNKKVDIWEKEMEAIQKAYEGPGKAFRVKPGCSIPEEDSDASVQ